MLLIDLRLKKDMFGGRFRATASSPRSEIASPRHFFFKTEINRHGFFLSVMALFLLSACSTSGKKGDAPVGSLREYVSRTFAIKSFESKGRLLELTTGQVRDTLEKMDEKSFQKNFIDEKKEFVALKIKDERALEDGRYSVTYELTYLNKAGGSSAKVTAKKHAIFEKSGARWLIAEVQNLKTFIEHENEMSF